MRNDLQQNQKEQGKVKKEKNQLWDFPGGPLAKTPHSQCRGPGFDLWSGNYIPHDATKRSHVTTKDSTCHTKIKDAVHLNQDPVQPHE